MGSGISGKYHGTRGSSQPYAPFYNVMPDMHKIDISRGIVQNGVYPKNPTAKDIRGGKIFSFDDRSGHFKPNPKSLEKAAEIFARLPKSVFHKNYIGGKSK